MIPFSQFKKKKSTPKEESLGAPQESVKMVSFKDFLGGGSYTVGPDRNKIYQVPRGYGGVATQEGMQRDHQFPVSLGGTSQKDNIKVKPLSEAKKKDKVLEYANAQYKAGKITLAQARSMVVNWQDTTVPGQQAENKRFGGDQNTLSNFFKALPGAVKSFPSKAKDVAASAISNIISPTPLSGRSDEETKLTPKDRREAFKSGPVGSLGYNLALQNSYITKNPSQVVDALPIKSVTTAAQIIAKTIKPAVILKELLGIGIDSKPAKILSQQLVKVKDATKVGNIIDNFRPKPIEFPKQSPVPLELRTKTTPIAPKTETSITEAKKYKTTINIQDKNDVDYLRRIFGEDTISDIKAGKKTNWRGNSYEDLARVNIISETPKTVEQQLAGKIKEIKLNSDTFYHGTNAENARGIMSLGFKRGSDLPEDAFRGGGYGKMQGSISFAETPKEASIFSTLSRDGKIVEAKLKNNARVVSIEGVEDATDLEDYIKYLKKEKIDAVYIGGGEKELAVINPKAITPTTPKADPLTTEARKYKSAEEFVNSFNLMKWGEVTGVGDLPISKLSKSQMNVLLKEGLPTGKGKLGMSANVTDTSNKSLKVGDFQSGKKVVQPIEVSQRGNSYVIENGRHRLFQALANGDETIPVVFKNGEGKGYVKTTKSQLTDIWKKANAGSKIDPLVAEAKKYKSAEEFVKKYQVEESLDMTPGATRIADTSETGVYHGAGLTNLKSILNDGKLRANASKLDQAGEKVISVSGNRSVANSYGVVMELDDAIPKRKAPDGVIKGDIFQGFEYRVDGDIPLSKIKSVTIPLNKGEGLNQKVMWDYSGKNPEYITAKELQKQFEDKGIKVFFNDGSNLTKSQLTDIWKKANLENNPEAGFARLPNGLPPKLNETINPVKELDEGTQAVYSKFVRSKLLAKETANEQLQKLSVPEKQGLKTILDYEEGHSDFGLNIKRVFDDLYNEATSKGLDINYRENYLPQVYKDKPKDVAVAVGKYLKDQGVEPKLIEEYLAGKAELPEDVSNRLKLNPSFSKQRVLPSYKVAMSYGLTPKYTNPGQLAAHYQAEIGKVVADKQFIDDLLAEDKLSFVRRLGWKPVDLPGSSTPYFAEPKLANMLEGLYRDEDNLKIGQSAIKGLATVSKKAQEITLSAGLPGTTVNFFAMGQFIKELTAGNIKSIPAFIRANFDSASIKYFQKNQATLNQMASQGLDVGNRIGNFETAYKGLRTGNIAQRAKQMLGEGWDASFNKKTFASFLPQLHVQTFKDVYDKALKKGLSKSEANLLAGDTTKAMFGLFEDIGRGKGTEDALSATLFAPKFREGIIRTLFNTGKSVTTEIRNPAFARNRKLVIGMALTYAGYNALNKKLNGNYMWDNEDNRQFALKIPRENGEVVYLEFMPSFLAFGRNLASGGIALAKGDFKTSAQKFGSVFSMPIKLASEVVGNKDYFGTEIYKDTDTAEQKIKKIASYIGLQVNHPFIRETIKQFITDQTKPIHQSLVAALELPLKFSSQDKITKAKFYEQQEKQKIEKLRTRERFMPFYQQIQELKQQGKEEEAQSKVDILSEEDYAIYTSIKASEKRKQTLDTKIAMQGLYDKIQELVRDGKDSEAQSIVDSLTEEQYKAYELLKKSD